MDFLNQIGASLTPDAIEAIAVFFFVIVAFLVGWLVWSVRANEAVTGAIKSWELVGGFIEDAIVAVADSYTEDDVIAERMDRYETELGRTLDYRMVLVLTAVEDYIENRPEIKVDFDLPRIYIKAQAAYTHMFGSLFDEEYEELGQFEIIS